VSRPIWNNLTHFKPNSTIDNWGDPAKMDTRLLVCIDGLREFLGYPLYVTSGYRIGDALTHGKGLAVDLMSPEYTSIKSLMDLYLGAERFGFTGIGVYPDWKWEGVTYGGIHVDFRFTDAARWMGVMKGMRQTYVGLNRELLKAYGIS